MFELKKAGFFKRASALLLDAILLAVLSTGFMWIISLICNFDAAWKTATNDTLAWESFRTTYVQSVADYYGYGYVPGDDISDDIVTIEVDGNVQSLPVDELIKKLQDDDSKSAEMEEAYQAYQNLTPYNIVNVRIRYSLSLLFVIISIGVLIAYLILEFILPIILKNGQTVGKKVFSICLVRANCVKISVLSLFARTLVGKYAIETMFPIMLVLLFIFGRLGVLAVVLLAAITLLNVILFFATKNRLPIHDAIAGTVAVDMTIQMIFQSEEELAEKKAQHKDFFNNSNSDKK